MAEQHEPDCPIRDDRENPYDGLVEVAESILASGRLKPYPVLHSRLETALAKVRGDG